MEALILVKAFLLQLQQAESFHIILGGWINPVFHQNFYGKKSSHCYIWNEDWILYQILYLQLALYISYPRH